MATVKLGILVAGLAGSVGGGTFQRDAQGTQLRTKPLPILRRTSFTAVQRPETAYLSRRWRELTNDQRAGWDLTASGLTWLNRFGDPITGHGYWLFLQCNQRLRQVGIDPVDDVQVVPTFDSYADFALVYDPSPKLELSWSTPSTVQAGTVLAVYATPRFSMGRSQPFGQQRFIGVIDAGASAPVDLYPKWNARFGQDLSVPANVLLTILPIDTVGGYAGPRYAVKSTI